MTQEIVTKEQLEMHGLADMVSPEALAQLEPGEVSEYFNYLQQVMLRNVDYFIAEETAPFIVVEVRDDNPDRRL